MPTLGEYSEVAICNLALTEIGRAGQITDMNEQSTSARACKQRYPYARDAVLRAYDWNFAGRRMNLPEDPTPPPFEYGNSYQLPEECLIVRSVYGGEGQMWTVEGRKILINLGGPLPIKYTALVVDPTQFDPLFVSALAARIAADICVAVSESTTRAQGLWTVYMNKLGEARRRDAQEGQPDQFPPGSWLASRHIG